MVETLARRTLLPFLVQTSQQSVDPQVAEGEADEQRGIVTQDMDLGAHGGAIYIVRPPGFLVILRRDNRGHKGPDVPGWLLSFRIGDIAVDVENGGLIQPSHAGANRCHWFKNGLLEHCGRGRLEKRIVVAGDDRAHAGIGGDAIGERLRAFDDAGKLGTKRAHSVQRWGTT